jgi:phosphatidate cytidylyltransferase
MFREVKRLGKVLSTQSVLPSFRPLHFYWFFSAMFFSYGRVLSSYFHFSLPYHTFISFMLYMAGIVVFVLSLESGYYKASSAVSHPLKLDAHGTCNDMLIGRVLDAVCGDCCRLLLQYQFEMFAWIHLTLLLIVVQSTFIVVNMFQGLIWSGVKCTHCVAAC